MTADATAAAGSPAPTTPATASNDLELHDNQDLGQFLERALEIKIQINARSRSKLGVNSEVVVALEAIPRVIGEDLIRLAVRRARTHPNDKYVLMEDVNWARARLVSGTGRSPVPPILTTLGGLFFGIGAPMILGAMNSGEETPILSSSVGWGAGCSVLGAVLLTWGIVLASRRG